MGSQQAHILRMPGISTAESRPDEAASALERLAAKEAAEKAHREAQERQQFAAEPARLKDVPKQAESAKAHQEELKQGHRAGEEKAPQEQRAAAAAERARQEQQERARITTPAERLFRNPYRWLISSGVPFTRFFSKFLPWAKVSALVLLLVAAFYWTFRPQPWHPQSSGTAAGLTSVAFVSAQALGGRLEGNNPAYHRRRRELAVSVRGRGCSAVRYVCLPAGRLGGGFGRHHRAHSRWRV